MNKELKIGIGVGILVLILSYLILQVFIPAYRSYQYACLPEKFEETTWKVAGLTTFDPDTKEIKVEIYQITAEVIKHEYCHVTQLKRKIWLSHSCTYPLQIIGSEIECYLAEDLPNKLYETLYGINIEEELMKFS